MNSRNIGAVDTTISKSYRKGRFNTTIRLASTAFEPSSRPMPRNDAYYVLGKVI